MDRLTLFKNLIIRSEAFDPLSIFDEYMVLYDIVNDQSIQILNCIFNKENEKFFIEFKTKDSAFIFTERVKENKYFKKFGDIFIIQAENTTDNTVEICILRDML